jgi:RND family efflux transporter MFP subunit
VSFVDILPYIRAMLMAIRRSARPSIIITIVIVLVIALPTGGMRAAGPLDRWWEAITGSETKSGAAAPTSPPAAVAPDHAAAALPTTTTQSGSTAPQPAPVPGRTQAQVPEPQATPIPVVRPKVESVSESLVVTGNAAAVTQVKLIARVVGFLEQIHFEDGALVRKGDLLFTIQQDQYKAQLQQAEAQLQLQKAALAYAKTEVVRYTALLKREAATQVDVDHWNFERQSAEANIRAAEAQIAIARLNLDYTEIRAPFDGLMGRHLIDTGNVVGGSGQEVALAEITQLDPIYVVANISSQQALQIRANLNQRRLTLAELHQIPIEAALSDETGFSHRGTIQYVAPAIDPATGTLYVRGILRNPDRTLLPGMFVNIRMPMGRTLRSALLVPSRALQEDQGGRYVLVVGPDGIIQQRYVQLGQATGSMQVVTSGLKPEDQVVVGDLWRAAPGTKVIPKLTGSDG